MTGEERLLMSTDPSVAMHRTHLNMEDRWCGRKLAVALVLQ